MAAVGKHFPGHGFVSADSHDETPVDDRALALLEKDDLVPFRALIGDGAAASARAPREEPRRQRARDRTDGDAAEHDPDETDGMHLGTPL